MSLRRAAWLVARREFTERIRSRAFQIATAITVAVVGAAAILAGVIGDDDATTYDVGVQGTEAFAIGGAARAAAPAFALRVELRPFPSPAAARAAVRDESVDAALVRGAIVSRDEPQEDLEQLLQGAGRQVRAGQALRSEGVSPAQGRQALNPPPLRTTLLGGEDDSGDQGLAFVASLLLYMQLII